MLGAAVANSGNHGIADGSEEYRGCRASDVQEKHKCIQLAIEPLTGYLHLLTMTRIDQSEHPYSVTYIHCIYVS